MDLAPPSLRNHQRSWRLVVAAVAVAPAVVFLVASILQNGLGIRGAATWMDPAFETAGLKVVTIGIVLVGPALAAILSLSWLLPLRWQRNEDAWEVRIRLRADPSALAILGVALVSGAILYGHIAAENAACIIGIASHC